MKDTINDAKKNIKQIANNETSLVEKTKKTKDDKLSNKSELKIN